MAKIGDNACEDSSNFEPNLESGQVNGLPLTRVTDSDDCSDLLTELLAGCANDCGLEDCRVLKQHPLNVERRDLWQCGQCGTRCGTHSLHRAGGIPRGIHGAGRIRICTYRNTKFSIN